MSAFKFLRVHEKYDQLHSNLNQVLDEGRSTASSEVDKKISEYIGTFRQISQFSDQIQNHLYKVTYLGLRNTYESAMTQIHVDFKSELYQKYATELTINAHSEIINIVESMYVSEMEYIDFEQYEKIYFNILNLCSKFAKGLVV